MNPEQLALLKAVCADPADDTVRLAYADWLDEHDQPDHAELIKVQIELSHTEPTIIVEKTRSVREVMLTKELLEGSTWELLDPRDKFGVLRHKLDNPKWKELKKREQELWNNKTWGIPNWKNSRWIQNAIGMHRPFPSETLVRPARDADVADSYIDVFWHRGFPQAIWTNLETFMEYAVEFFETNPITNVTLLCRTPRNNRVWGMREFIMHSHELPRNLFRCLPDPSHATITIYDTEAQAYEALVMACLRYGRGWTPEKES